MFGYQCLLEKMDNIISAHMKEIVGYQVWRSEKTYGIMHITLHIIIIKHLMVVIQLLIYGFGIMISFHKFHMANMSFLFPLYQTAKIKFYTLLNTMHIGKKLTMEMLW